ncbi:hypothetical protein F2Q65_00915 [Thiohalocapsa marina]|uniref:Glycine zipper family protein n=1 Tax=Thiohalocapsa marina TaxID=424902 RepID=A0A5M8FVZ3_9GAMM|nr:hypothetical protein F2Q65_00915 [Thiohalocapsa marina]
MLVPSLVLAAALTAGGCSSTQSTWTPTVDTYGNDRAQYLSRDLAECRALAMQASGGDANEQAARSAATKGAIGAAVGAGVGAVLAGDSWRGARQGAAVGVATGALAGGLGTASQTEAEFKRAYSNCMRRRGHNVLN